MYIQGGNCIENAVFTVAAHYNREYPLLLVDTYGLLIDEKYMEFDDLSDAIRFRESNMFGYMEKYCSIKVVNKLVNQTEDIENILEELEHDNFVLVMMDSYYCNHLEQYQKYHMEHGFLAFSSNQDFIYLIDPNIGTEVFRLSKENFALGVKEVFFFQVKEVQTQNYYNILTDSVLRLNDGGVIENVALLKEIIGQPELVIKVFEPYEKEIYQIVPFLLSISKIGGRRNLYALFLEYIAEKTKINGLTAIAESFRYCASKWYLWRNMILKSVYTKSYSEKRVQRLQQIIDEIIEMEKLCVKELNDCLVNNKEGGDLQLGTTEMNISRFVYVNLQQYYNNKGCSHDIIPNGDFTLRGQYFCDLELPSKEEILANGMLFQFPDVAYNFDNIMCDGQEIEIPCDTYKQIMLLGCSENGDAFDYLQLVTAHGEKVKVKAAFTTWIADMPHYDDSKALSFTVYDKNKMEFLKRKSNLFTTNHDLNSKFEYHKIILPVYENLHIFSMTLAK